MPRPMPFPLASGRYEVGPAMRRFGQAGQGFAAEAGHFQPDDLLATTLAAKLAVLRRAPRQCHLIAPGLTAAEAAELRAALQDCFRLLAAEHPELATVAADGVTLHHLGLRLAEWDAPTPRLEPAGAAWPELEGVAPAVRAWLAEQAGLWRLGDALGLAVQEDLALVRGPAGAPGGRGKACPGGDGLAGTGRDAPADPGADRADVLEWLHVCLPSNWVPAEKVGGSFAAVHAPVVHNAPLLAAQAQIVRAMIHGGPFVRYVWGIHSDAALCHNPRLHQPPPWPEGAPPAALAAMACFRVERQTTHGFPALNRALFTIRYWVAPLTEVAADPWRRERIAAALAGMDAAALRYKGLTGARDGLVAWLRGED